VLGEKAPSGCSPVTPPAISISVVAGGLPLGQKVPPLRLAIYHRCDLCRAKDKTLNRPTIFPRFLLLLPFALPPTETFI